MSLDTRAQQMPDQVSRGRRLRRCRDIDLWCCLLSPYEWVAGGKWGPAVRLELFFAQRMRWAQHETNEELVEC